MRLILICLSLLVATTQPVLAFEKGDVEITPMFGVYSPTANTLDEPLPGGGFATAKHASSVAGGARLSFWTKPKLGIELTGLYTSSTLDGQALGLSGEMGANHFFGSGRIVLAPGAPGQVRLLLSGGLVVITQNYDEIDGSSFVSGVVGVGLHVPLSENAALRLDLDDYVYTKWFEVGDVSSTKLTQHDLVATVGIAFNVGD